MRRSSADILCGCSLSYALQHLLILNLNTKSTFTLISRKHYFRDLCIINFLFSRTGQADVQADRRSHLWRVRPSVVCLSAYNICVVAKRFVLSINCPKSI